MKTDKYGRFVTLFFETFSFQSMKCTGLKSIVKNEFWITYYLNGALKCPSGFLSLSHPEQNTGNELEVFVLLLMLIFPVLLI
jgi:hypothetical protein